VSRDGLLKGSGLREIGAGTKCNNFFKCASNKTLRWPAKPPLYFVGSRRSKFVLFVSRCA